MSEAATITMKTEDLDKFLTERDAERDKKTTEEISTVVGEAFDKLGLGRSDGKPVQSDDGTRDALPVDERLDQMRTESVPLMRVVSGGMTEGWERKAEFHYKTCRQIPEAARALRNTEDDWHIKEWALGQMTGNPGRSLRAAEFLMRKYARVSGNLANIATLGLELVPEPLSDLVWVQRQLSQVMQPLCTNFTSSNGNIRVPKELVVADATKVAQTTDAIVPVPSITLAAATFARLRLDVKKGKVLLAINDELLDQNAFDVVTLISGQAGRALGRLSDTQIVVDGDGVGENHTDSLLENADVIETTAGALFTDVKVRKMWADPIAGHRANGIWVTDVAGLVVLNQLEDSGGKVVFTPADAALSVLVGQGQGVTGIGTMLSRPVYEVVDANGRLFFGDPEAIGVLSDGKGIRSKIEPIPGLDTAFFQWTEQQDSRLLEGTAWTRTDAAIALT